MRATASTLILGASLTVAFVCFGQVAQFYPTGSPPMDKTKLLKLYDGIESEVPQWSVQMKAITADPNGTYAVGTILETMKKDGLKTIDDLSDTLDRSKDEDFKNQAEVSFIECRVKDDLGEIAETFDTQNAAEESSSGDSAQLTARMLANVRTIAPYQRILRIDLENRLHDMALSSARMQ
jgi:hypothetical protein